MSAIGLVVRWCPSELTIADAMTKDHADPSDLLRAALQIGEYQLNAEATILEAKKQHRTERKKLSAPKTKTSTTPQW